MQLKFTPEVKTYGIKTLLLQLVFLLGFMLVQIQYKPYFPDFLLEHIWE